MLTLIGRLFLVLAGGFFLRAMTEAGLLAPRIGIALAFVYAVVWLFMADRAGRRQQVTNAVFHALAAAMVAFPLLLEATTRFKVLAVAGSLLGVGLLVAVLLLVAWRQRLQAIAWIAVLAALLTCLVLLVKTGAFVPFALCLIALGLVTLWLGYWLGWNTLAWPAALAADTAVAGVTLGALSPAHHDLAQVAMLLQWSLLGGYIVSIAIQTLVRKRKVTVFEIGQTVVGMVLAFGGTIVLTRSGGSLPVGIGVVSLLFGAVCYAANFAFVDRQLGLSRNVYFYSTLALVLVLAGLDVVLRPPWLGLAFALLSVMTAFRWFRVGRLYMLIHAATYIVAAGLASGALGYGARALATGWTGPWLLPSAATFLVLVAAATSAGLAAARPDPEGGALANGLRVVMAVTLVWLASAWVVGYLAPLAAGLVDGSVDPGPLATLRTAVLSLAVLVAAWLSRRARFREWAWLVYPLLVVVGLKMVVQDFKDSRPATLFIALALYGIALIAAPRIKRSGRRPSSQPEGA
ncbi:MAG TPA: hypothetical protein VLM41_04840 [Steroidobacteraceae bacterium]|nr:hypothetical protein [Steroidobacteraceae bacterium]